MQIISNFTYVVRSSMGTKKNEQSTQKAIDAMRNYIGRMTKKEKEQIQRELEKDLTDEEEPPFRYKSINFLTDAKWSVNFNHYPIPYEWSDGGSLCQVNPEPEDEFVDVKDE